MWCSDDTETINEGPKDWVVKSATRADWNITCRNERPHSALVGRPPVVAYWLRKDETQSGRQELRVA